MSSTGEVKASPLSVAIDPYRSRLATDSRDFTVALLALAKSNANGTSSFNAPSAQDGAALHALAHWRRDAQHALRRVRSVEPQASGRKLAERWLKTLIAALDLQRQALSLASPDLAAAAAGSARQKIAEYHRLGARLDRVLA